MTYALTIASFEMLDHLRAFGPATAAQIYAALSPGRPALRPRDTMRRLNRLQALRWVYSEVDNHGALRWHAVAMAPSTSPAALRAPAAPRAINIMNTTWAPPPGPALRPGALDFQRCASRGVRCWHRGQAMKHPNTPAQSRAEHLDEITGLAYRLVEIVSEQRTHLVALEALIGAYCSVAMCHPCCAQRAADLARQIANVIETTAPQGVTHVH